MTTPGQVEITLGGATAVLDVFEFVAVLNMAEAGAKLAPASTYDADYDTALIKILAVLNPYTQGPGEP